MVCSCADLLLSFLLNLLPIVRLARIPPLPFPSNPCLSPSRNIPLPARRLSLPLPIQVWETFGCLSFQDSLLTGSQGFSSPPSENPLYCDGTLALCGFLQRTFSLTPAEEMLEFFSSLPFSCKYFPSLRESKNPPLCSRPSQQRGDASPGADSLSYLPPKENQSDSAFPFLPFAKRNSNADLI